MLTRAVLALCSLGLAWMAWQFWRQPGNEGRGLAAWVVVFWRAGAAIGAAFAAIIAAVVAFQGEVPTWLSVGG